MTLETNSVSLAFAIGEDSEASRERRAETCKLFPCSGSCTCISYGIILLLGVSDTLGAAAARCGGVAWWVHKGGHL